MLLRPLAAGDGTDATPPGVAAEAAITAPSGTASGSLIGVTLAPGGFSLAAVNVLIRSLTNSAGHQLISDADGTFSGSEQEFDRRRILGCFLENHEFGLGRCHALGFQ